MAYNDFTLKKLKDGLGITIFERQSLFENIEILSPSLLFQSILARNLPLALVIHTEKARSELLIINFLLEARSQLADKVSLFSGIDFNVDKDQGLNGFCDYILSAAQEQFYLEAPTLMVVEAKNDNLISGLGPCGAEMYAAQSYNQRENHPSSQIYGVVTTGTEWKFLRLEKMNLFIDQDAYYINQAAQIVSILVAILSHP